MKKFLFLLTSLLFLQLAFAQKKEKLKGSKIVVIQKKPIESFTQLEVLDNIEINLIKGDKCGVELEADDNLQDVLDIRKNGEMLIISFAKEIMSFKKFNIRITYTDALTLISAKDKSKIMALQALQLDKVTINAIDNAKIFLNIDVKNCTISANDKVQVELNAKSETLTLVSSKNAIVKALVSATSFKCDLYQNANTKIEGDVINMNLRLEGNSNFDGKILNCKTTELTVEGNAKCAILGEENITIMAKNRTTTDVYGNAKINLQKFEDTAILRKKI